MKLWSVDSSNLLAIVRIIAEQVSASWSSSLKWRDFTVSIIKIVVSKADNPRFRMTYYRNEQIERQLIEVQLQEPEMKQQYRSRDEVSVIFYQYTLKTTNLDTSDILTR